MALLIALPLCVLPLLARTLVTQAELPIGILTALRGGPFFLALLMRWISTGLSAGDPAADIGAGLCRMSLIRAFHAGRCA